VCHAAAHQPPVLALANTHRPAAPAGPSGPASKDDIASMFDPTMQAGYTPASTEPAAPLDPECMWPPHPTPKRAWQALIDVAPVLLMDGLPGLRSGTPRQGARGGRTGGRVGARHGVGRRRSQGACGAAGLLLIHLVLSVQLTGGWVGGPAWGMAPRQLAAWRLRREGNIRALLPSLDMVLWPELEWTPISLSELVTPAQVKVRYMKAINKVHPDKVRPPHGAP
jgi:hypothetical protein